MSKIAHEYSPLKICHYIEWLKLRRSGHILAPVHVQISPTNRCNHHCIYCAYRISEYPSSEKFNPKDEIPFSDINRILVDAAASGTKAVQITGGGEPLMHPNIAEILELSASLGLSIGLVSNGARMTSELADFLGREATWVRISLDSGENYTHSLIHGTSQNDWDKVISGIDYLVQAKHKYRSNIVIGIGFVVCKENIFNIKVAALVAKHLGVDSIRFSMAFTGEVSGGLSDERIKKITTDGN